MYYRPIMYTSRLIILTMKKNVQFQIGSKSLTQMLLQTKQYNMYQVQTHDTYT